MTPVAEVGLYAIDDTSRKSTKRVLPLRISVSSYFSFSIFSPLLICIAANFFKYQVVFHVFVSNFLSLARQFRFFAAVCIFTCPHVWFTLICMSISNKRIY
jgi:hypothetical protein